MKYKLDSIYLKRYKYKALDYIQQTRFNLNIQIMHIEHNLYQLAC